MIKKRHNKVSLLPACYQKAQMPSLKALGCALAILMIWVALVCAVKPAAAALLDHDQRSNAAVHQSELRLKSLHITPLEDKSLPSTGVSNKLLRQQHLVIKNNDRVEYKASSDIPLYNAPGLFSDVGILFDDAKPCLLTISILRVNDNARSRAPPSFV